jgi:integrase
MAKKSRRTRSPHPGVVLIPPDEASGHQWRARYIDPDSGKTRKVKIDSVLGSEAARRDWAIRLSKTLGKRRMDLEAGAPRETGTLLTDAVEQYFTDHKQLREGTLGVYRTDAGKLLTWAQSVNLVSADQLTGPRLLQFRASLIRAPLPVSVKGGKKGEKASAPKTRRPSTVNRELRSVGTVLGYLRKLGLLPRMSSDELRDSLEKLGVSKVALKYLTPADLQALLEAALRHDAATFKETRAEHAGPGRAELGSTARYPAVAPFIATLVLSGMRFGEAAGLKWAWVDFDALDHEGRAVGEIHLPPEATKTDRGRIVGLEVAPALRELLLTMNPERRREGKVFDASPEGLRNAIGRLRSDFGGPPQVTPQLLRQTVSTYLTCAPGIFGSTSAYRSAAQLGHSVKVASDLYTSPARGIPREARTLEAAMQIEKQMAQVINAVGGRG